MSWVNRFWIWLTCFASHRAMYKLPSRYRYMLANCVSKGRFDTEESCQKSINSHEKISMRNKLHAYKCNFCRKWHKTRKQIQ